MDCPSRALVPTSQFQEESPLSAQSRSVFQSLLFDFSLGNKKLKLPLNMTLMNQLALKLCLTIFD